MQTRSQTRMLNQTNITTPKKQKNMVSSSNQESNIPVAPMKHGYRTRSTTNSLKDIKKNLIQEFDTAFFDDSSNEWNKNKIKLRNGMYVYSTRSKSKL